MRRTATAEKMRGGAPARKVRPRDHEYRPIRDNHDDDQELDVVQLVPGPRAAELDESVRAAQRRLNGL